MGSKGRRMASWGTEGDHVLLFSEEPPSMPRRLSEYVVAQEMPARAEFSRLLALIKKGRVQADVASDAASRHAPGTLGAHSGHSSGTVWALGSIPTAQKCPSRLARPARFERATGMFVMQELTRCPGSRSPPLPFSSARRAGCGRKRRTPPTIPDRVRGQFTASAPDVLWVGDINSRAHRGKAG